MKRNLASLAVPLILAFTTSVAAQGVKWHPGHYVMLGTENSRALVLRRIDEIGREPAIRGVQVRVRWHDLEKQKGVYDFSMIDAYLARLKAQPTRKQLVVRVIDRKFNTSSAYGIVPDYLRTSAYHGGVVRTQTGYAARIWETSVMDRLIALDKHLAWRYDGNVRFEGLATEETTLGVRSPTPSGYSNATLAWQYRRLVNALAAAMPHSNFFLYTNFIGSSSLMDGLMQTLMRAPGAAGGSNVVPGRKSLGQKVWTGVYGADYRWILPLSSSVETGELRSYTPRQINDFAYNQLHLNYIFWVYNTWAGDASRRWATGILPFLRTKPPFRSACPSNYGICRRW